MSDLAPLFAVALGLIALLTVHVLWSSHALWRKVGSLVTAGGLTATAAAGFVTLLSQPKPIGLEWWQAQAAEATVLESLMREGVGIYLWLQLPDVTEPRSYVLPWNRDLAEQLQRAAREAEENQSGLKMRLPFEPSLDDRAPKFYAMPQPSVPPKPEPPVAKVIERDV